MKIYISIPITGYDKKAVRERADIIKAALSRKGHKAITPFDINHGKNPTYNDYICNDLRAMLDCDAVFFAKGWEDSCGCGIEHDTAQRYNAAGRKAFKFIYE